jgi:hypothetical protein
VPEEDIPIEIRIANFKIKTFKNNCWFLFFNLNILIESILSVEDIKYVPGT